MATVKDSGKFLHQSCYRQIAWTYISINQKIIHVNKSVAMPTTETGLPMHVYPAFLRCLATQREVKYHTKNVEYKLPKRHARYVREV